MKKKDFNFNFIDQIVKNQLQGYQFLKEILDETVIKKKP